MLIEEVDSGFGMNMLICVIEIRFSLQTLLTSEILTNLLSRIPSLRPHVLPNFVLLQPHEIVHVLSQLLMLRS